MRVRKTIRQRIQEVAEGVERLYRDREEYYPDAPDSLAAELRNTAVVPADSESVRALQRLDQSLRAQARQVAEPDFLWPVVCSDHAGPPWRPAPVHGIGPQPAKALCPMCRAQAEAAKPEGQVVYLDGGGPVKATTARQDELHQQWLAKQEAADVILPSTEKERVTLEEMDDERREAIRRDKTPKGRQGMKLVYHRPYDNVSVYRPIKKRRRGQRQLPLFDPSGRIFVEAD